VPVSTAISFSGEIMPEEDRGTGKVTEVVKAVGELVDKVPIYQDAIQPAAKEVGKGLKVVAHAVNVALIPVEGLIWGVEQIRDFVRERVEKKLENVPPDEIQQPKPHIAVPAIDALRYTGSEDTLSELYANLLATSMDRATAYRAHPGFVDMIKNMCPDEARIMKWLAVDEACPLVNIKSVSNKDRSYMVTHRYVSLLGVDAGCEHVPLTPNYIDNLERLGLVQIDSMSILHDDEVYKRIEEFPQIKGIIEDLNKTEERKSEVQRIGLQVTDLGKQFIRSCVIDKNAQPRS
jgi:hypothetical protein